MKCSRCALFLGIKRKNSDGVGCFCITRTQTYNKTNTQRSVCFVGVLGLSFVICVLLILGIFYIRLDMINVCSAVFKVIL